MKIARRMIVPGIWTMAISTGVAVAGPALVTVPSQASHENTPQTTFTLATGRPHPAAAPIARTPSLPLATLGEKSAVTGTGNVPSSNFSCSEIPSISINESADPTSCVGADGRGDVIVAGQYELINTGFSPVPLTAAEANFDAWVPKASTIEWKANEEAAIAPSVLQHFLNYAGVHSSQQVPAATYRSTATGTPTVGSEFPILRLWDGYHTYQQYENWCGPASVAIALDTDLNTGGYYQSQIAQDMSVPPHNGASSASGVAHEMNNLYLAARGDGDGFYTYEKPGSAIEYLTWVIQDTYYHNVAAVNNVMPTKDLTYWGGLQSVGHFNLSDGYNEVGGVQGSQLFYFDEFDPTKVYANWGSRPNPYGEWAVSLFQEAYPAVMDNGSSQYVIH